MSSRRSLSSTASMLFPPGPLRRSYETENFFGVLVPADGVADLAQSRHLLLFKFERLAGPAVRDHVIHPQVLQFFALNQVGAFLSAHRTVGNLHFLLQVLCENSRPKGLVGH